MAGSVPRLSGAADTRGARRTVAKRSAVEKCIIIVIGSESLPGLLDQPAGCVRIIYITKERPGVRPGYPESYLQNESSEYESRQCMFAEGLTEGEPKERKRN